MVLKINGIFEARRGKKRMKRVSQSTESSSGRGKCCLIKHKCGISRTWSVIWCSECFMTPSHCVFLSHLIDAVTDENSESESDTEEKLKGEEISRLQFLRLI